MAFLNATPRHHNTSNKSLCHITICRHLLTKTYQNMMNISTELMCMLTMKLITGRILGQLQTSENGKLLSPVYAFIFRYEKCISLLSLFHHIFYINLSTLLCLSSPPSSTFIPMFTLSYSLTKQVHSTQSVYKYCTSSFALILVPLPITVFLKSFNFWTNFSLSTLFSTKVSFYLPIHSLQLSCFLPTPMTFFQTELHSARMSNRQVVSYWAVTLGILPCK